MSMLSSTNPVLSDQSLGRVMGQIGDRSTTASVQGVMAKTGICTILAVGAGAAGYALVTSMPSILWISAIVSMVVSLILFFVISSNPKIAMIGAPVYSITQGVFLGAISCVLESMLTARGISVPGGIALQAFIIRCRRSSSREASWPPCWRCTPSASCARVRDSSRCSCS